MPLHVADSDTLRTIRQRWNSMSHVGEAKPECRAYVRTVRISRAFRVTDPDNIYSQVPGLTGRKQWRGELRVKNSYVQIPNLRAVTVEQDYDQNGVAQMTMELDNVNMVETSGVAGVFHLVTRGYYAPLRGWNPPGKRPAVGEQNVWFDRLRDKSSQITVIMGYGDAMIPVFTGLINDCDLTSNPDVITVIARDFGQLLTDQHVFINAKIKGVKDPITFADRRASDKTYEYAVGSQASSSDGMHPHRFVRDKNDSFWQSTGNAHQGAMEWVEIDLPPGRYKSFVLDPKYAGMEAYIAVDARDKNAPGGRGARRRFDEALPQDWIDEGRGNVPGTSIPWVKKIDRVKGKETHYSFPDYGYILGEGSRIRVFLTNLDYGFHGERHKNYRAGVVRLAGVHEEFTKESRKWILVKDLSDVVKTVLQWCAFEEWEVETTGVRLKDKTVFNRGNFLIDIINDAADQVGYTFSIKPPEVFDEDDLTPENEANLSIGIPVFRQNQAMRRGEGVFDRIEEVHEDRTLLGINAKFTDEPLAYNIRVRGKEKKRKRGGRTLGGDRTTRWMYVYRPPWSRDRHPGGNWPDDGRDEYRNANVKKYVVHHDPKLRSVQECKIAALFIAFREALESAQVQIEIPALPSIYLDHQTAVYDTGSGISARVWIALRTVRWRGGESPEFRMALGGSLLDSPDVSTVREELVRALRHAGYNPGLSEHDLRHWWKQYRNREYEQSHQYAVS